MHFILILIISAFIGWLITNLFIKMLFHPVKPFKLSGFTFQGIVPKRHQEFAITVGKLVSDELLSFSALEQKMADPANVAKLLPVLEIHIDTFLREKLTTEIPMIGMLIGDKTILQVKRVFMKELEELFPILIRQYFTTLQNDINPGEMVREKVIGFSLAKLENSLKEQLSTELRFIKTVGAVAGLLIGLLNILITIAVN